MNSQPARRSHVPAPSTKGHARAIGPNPLWVIAIAMGAFFGATALIMLV